MSVLLTFLALSFVVFIHEWGHMIMAKKAGIAVYEFSVGMGPRIYSFEFNNTEYSFRAIPLGGYVKLAGMDDSDEYLQKNVSGIKYQDASVFGRFMTIFAGPLMNVILGFFTFLSIFLFFGMSVASPVIDAVVSGSPAEMVGIQKGDILSTVNNKKVADVKTDFIDIVNKSVDTEVLISIERNGNRIDKVVIPKAKTEGSNLGVIGVVLGSETVKLGFIESITESLNTTWVNVKMVFISLKMLITGQASAKDMAGPIGIIEFASFSLSKGAQAFIYFIGMISISLGIINLFPFPVLDGGHIVLLGIEAIRKKPLSERFEKIINGTGMAILFALIGFVIFNDIFNWNERVELINKLSKP